MERLWAAFSTVALAAVISACSSSATVDRPAEAPPSTVAITFIINKPATQSNARIPAFVSPNAQSASIAITGPNGAKSDPFVGNCSGNNCSQTVKAPFGVDTFAVSLYQGMNATGTLLSSGSVTANIVAGQTNTVSVTFNPIVGSAAATVAVVPAGTPTSIPVSVIAYDPSGASIIGPGVYQDANGNPVTVSVSVTDPSGHVALSGPGTFTTGSPSTTLSYDGTPPHLFSAKLNVFVNGNLVTSYAVTFTPSPVGSPIPIGAAGQTVTAMTEGPDGNIWLSMATPAQITKYAVTGGTVANYPLQFSDADPTSITLGGDGALWFFEQNRNNFGRSTTSGGITEYRVAYQAYDLVKGVDGNVWFFTTQSPPQVGKITSAGIDTTYSLPSGYTPTSSNGGLSPGPNGRMWMFFNCCSAADSVSLAGIATDGTGFTASQLTLPAPNGVINYDGGGKIVGMSYSQADGVFYGLDYQYAFTQALFAVSPTGTGTVPYYLFNHSGQFVTGPFGDGIFFAVVNSLPAANGTQFLGINSTGTANFTASSLNKYNLVGVAPGGDGFIYFCYSGQLIKFAY